MATWGGPVTSIRLTLDERERIDALAASLGVGRSRLLRAAFAAIEHEDPERIRFYLTRQPEAKPPPRRRGRRSA